MEESFRMQASILDAQLERELKILEASLTQQSDLMNSRLDHASKSSLQNSKQSLRAV